MNNHNDQAQGLRERVAGARSDGKKGARVLAIAGGKGGVGKTSLAVNIASQLSRAGETVLLFDANYGLGNADIHLGLSPEKTLQDCLTGDEPLLSAVTEVNPRLSLIAAGSGSYQMANADPVLIEGLLLEMERLADDYDWVIIDSGSGIGERTLNTLQYADDILVVTTPDPSSLADSYATIKIALRRDPEANIRILVNRVNRSAEAEAVYNQLEYVCRKYLGRTLPYAGWIPEDERVLTAAKSQKAVADLWPMSRFSQSVARFVSAMGVKSSEGKKGFKDIVRQFLGSAPWEQGSLSA